MRYEYDELVLRVYLRVRLYYLYAYYHLLPNDGRSTTDALAELLSKKRSAAATTTTTSPRRRTTAEEDEDAAEADRGPR